jgi:HPt (histidine-containing phosphotransfer) domain-containing protein
MYYIMNQNDQIVAIDPQLLSQLKIESADEFYKKVALQEITFDLNGHNLTINVDDTIRHYTVVVSPLDGMLGDIRLVDVDTESLQEETAVAETPQEQEPLLLDEIDLFGIKDENETEEASLLEKLTLDEETSGDTLSIGMPEIQEEEKAEEKIEEEEDDLFELILPSDADTAISEIDTGHAPSQTEETSNTPEIDLELETEEIALVETPKPESQQETVPSLPTEENTPIYIDIEQVSQTIGISPDDYNLFLNEYIDTALTFEEALQSQDEEKKKEALHTLSHLSNVLHLPFVGELLNRIKNASLSERDQAIEAFFATLGRLTTADFEEEKKAENDETVQTIQVDAGEEVSEEIVEARRHTIDLSDIKPVHFDFQLEEAAKDLSLPVELIEEFVHDFIKQAHEETQKMIEAYEKGDLETVQKIGHLLKGTSSNLRINPLADTLYEIQFNDDIDRVPELVKHYWAHFLSLENQIKLIAKK